MKKNNNNNKREQRPRERRIDADRCMHSRGPKISIAFLKRSSRGSELAGVLVWGRNKALVACASILGAMCLSVGVVALVVSRLALTAAIGVWCSGRI